MPSSLKTLNQYANIIAGEPEESKLKRFEEKKIHMNKNTELKKEKNNFEFLFDNDEKKDHNQINKTLDETPKNEKFLDENKEEIKLELKEESLKEEILDIKEESKTINSKPISTNLSRKKKT